MPRADFRSLSFSAGRTNNQPCQKTKGNAAMNPAMADTKMWVVKVAQHGGVDELVIDAVDAQGLAGTDPFRQLAPRTKRDKIHVTRPKQHHVEQPVFGQKQANAPGYDKKRRIEEALAQFF